MSCATPAGPRPRGRFGETHWAWGGTRPGNCVSCAGWPGRGVHKAARATYQPEFPGVGGKSKLP
eukprot:12499923-Alexandrium_andersonii.AAC.1